MTLKKRFVICVCLATVLGFLSVEASKANDGDESNNVNYSGVGSGTFSFEGVEVELSEKPCLSECDGELIAGQAAVLAQSADLGTGLTLSIDNGAEGNYAVAEPESGESATLTIYLDPHLDFFGERIDTDDQMILVSDNVIESFPPEEAVTYTLENDVAFDGPCGQFVLHAGASVTLSQAP